MRRAPVWVSHLTVTNYRVLRTALGVRTHLRVGTRLWLGEQRAYRTTATVLDVHRIRRGAPLGYHGVRAPRDGWIVIASGGTAHGLAMAAPTPQRSLRQRGVTVARVTRLARTIPVPVHDRRAQARVRGAASHALVDGVRARRRRPRRVGDAVPVTVRMTTVTADETRLV